MHIQPGHISLAQLRDLHYSKPHARGFSGVREVVIDLLLALYDHACSSTNKTTPVFTKLKDMLTEEIRFKVHKAAGLHVASA